MLCVFIHPSIYLSICLSIYLSIYLSISISLSHVPPTATTVLSYTTGDRHQQKGTHHFGFVSVALCSPTRQSVFKTPLHTIQLADAAAIWAWLSFTCARQTSRCQLESRACNERRCIFKLLVVHLFKLTRFDILCILYLHVTLLKLNCGTSDKTLFLVFSV